MIEGMMCQNCVKHVTHALEGISGASHVRVVKSREQKGHC
ncbi:MAG: heavy-metal-associated domain-containing protein [Blautia faecis]